MDRAEYLNRTKSHYEEIWGSEYSECEWSKGPVHRHPPGLKILEFPAGTAHQMWTYATVGMSCEKHNPAIELQMFSPYSTDRIVELLTILATHHYHDQEIGLNHKLDFGEPWLEQSQCTRAFISLPYLDGPKLETLCDGTLHVQFLWALPITPEEADFLETHTVEELERKFEEQQLDFVDINRTSVV